MKNFDIISVGYNCLDKLCTVENYPEEDGSTHIIGMEIQGGGASASAAAAAAVLGSSCAFIGNVGFDKTSDEIIRLLSLSGVSTDYIIRREDSFPLESFIMVNREKGTRTKFPTRDTTPEILWTDKLVSVLQSARILHLDGTHYVNAINALSIAKKAGVTVSLDGCSRQNDNDKNRALASDADILIMNEKYPLIVSGINNHEDALVEISTWGPEFVMCTLGEKGSMAVIDGKIRRFPAYPVKAIDSTGAGDVFHGAFLHAYLKGMDAEECVGFASVTAALKCEKPGGRSVPKYEEVEKEFLKYMETLNRRFY